VLESIYGRINTTQSFITRHLHPNNSRKGNNDQREGPFIQSIDVTCTKQI